MHHMSYQFAHQHHSWMCDRPVDGLRLCAGIGVVDAAVVFKVNLSKLQQQQGEPADSGPQHQREEIIGASSHTSHYG